MSENNNETKRPTHAVYAVIGEGKKTRWHRIGAAWPNKDGKGLNLMFDSLPLTGRVSVRVITEKDDDKAQAGGQE